jgi:histidinol-phosphate aminotransferase
MKNIADLAVPGVQKLSPYQPGKPVSELERELGITNIIKLASNENPLGVPASAVTAMQKSLADIALYPDGSAFDLKATLAQKLSVNANQITVGNGSNELLDLIARVFLSPENNAVISEYAFVVYAIAVQSLGAELRVAKAKDFGHDLDAMTKLVDGNTRMVFIANPNNPTGTCLGVAAIERFLQTVPSDVIVVLDEAYHEYVGREDYASGSDAARSLPQFNRDQNFFKGLRLGRFACRLLRFQFCDCRFVKPFARAI